MRFDSPAPIPLGTTSRQRRCYVFPPPPGLIRVKVKILTRLKTLQSKQPDKTTNNKLP